MPIHHPHATPKGDATAPAGSRQLLLPTYGPLLECVAARTFVWRAPPGKSAPDAKMIIISSSTAIILIFELWTPTPVRSSSRFSIWN
eukprot:scaffold44_cov411-Prasinococcus_capsulatus_cf.AAC.37